MIKLELTPDEVYQAMIGLLLLAEEAGQPGNRYYSPTSFQEVWDTHNKIAAALGEQLDRANLEAIG